jgi:soluble cytochrome b562
MAIFYIKTTSGDVFELTATTDVAFSLKNSNTRFPVESGYTATDHSTVENTSFTLDGIITEVVQLNKQSPQKGIKDYIEGLDKLRKSFERFTVYLDNRLTPFINCLFTDLSYKKSQTEGVGAWRVSLSIEQIRIVDKAKASSVQIEATESTDNADGDIKDSVDGKTEEGNKPTRETSLFKKGVVGLKDIIDNSKELGL